MNINDLFTNNLAWLREASNLLAKSAVRLTRISMIAKVTIIVLGAVAATNGTAVSLLGEENSGVVLAYTLVGLIITAVSGLDAAFRFESRASGRRLLAGEVYAKNTELLARWTQRSAPVAEGEEQETARALLTDQVAYIAEVQSRAAELGVNLQWESMKSRGEVEGYERIEATLESTAMTAMAEYEDEGFE